MSHRWRKTTDFYRALRNWLGRAPKESKSSRATVVAEPTHREWNPADIAAAHAAGTDWHPADIVAAVRKTGATLAELARRHGYRAPGTLNNALLRPYPKAERIIAREIGVAPERIWPSRYDAKGRPNRPLGRPPEQATPERTAKPRAAAAAMRRPPIARSRS